MQRERPDAARKARWNSENIMCEERPAVQGNARALGLCSVMFVSSAGMVSDVRFGSLADIRARIWNVSFTPKSGHS